MSDSTPESLIQLRFDDFKPCPGCGKVKLRSEFWKNKHSRDGLQSACIECLKNQRCTPKGVQYRENYQSQYRIDHKEVRSEYMRTYKKEYRQRDYVKTQVSEYIKQPQARALRSKHFHRYLARKHSVPGDHTPQEWRHLCELAGSKCLRCGQVRKLTKDHIQPLTKGGCNCIHNLQPLCNRCNAAKGNRHSTDYRTPEIIAWLSTISHVHEDDQRRAQSDARS